MALLKSPADAAVSSRSASISADRALSGPTSSAARTSNASAVLSAPRSNARLPATRRNSAAATGAPAVSLSVAASSHHCPGSPGRAPWIAPQGGAREAYPFRPDKLGGYSVAGQRMSEAEVVGVEHHELGIRRPAKRLQHFIVAAPQRRPQQRPVQELSAQQRCGQHNVTITRPQSGQALTDRLDQGLWHQLRSAPPVGPAVLFLEQGSALIAAASNSSTMKG